MKKNSGIISFFLSILFFSFLIFKPALGQDAGLLPNAVQQFFDGSGNPLGSGKVYFYQVGTSTFKDVYNSSAATTPYTNPITLNAGGKPPGSSGIYGIGLYRQVVKDKNGNTIWDAVTAPGGGSGGTPTNIGDGNAVGTVLPWSGLTAPSQYVFTYGQELIRTDYPEFYSAITLQTNVICTASSNTLTGIADTSQIPIGSPVELALCVPPGSTVISKTSGTVTLNNPANVSLNATARFFPYGNGNGSTTFNVPDFRGATLIGRNNMGGSASSRLANGNSIGQVLAFTPTTYTISQSSVSLTSGSGTFSVGSNVSKLYIKMVAGGGGGAAATVNNGANGADTSFGSWTAIHGNGGVAGGGAGGSGGAGGTNGTGTLITRINGGSGSGTSNTAAAVPMGGGAGGNTAFGGAGGGSASSTLAASAATNSGSGGGGGSGAGVGGGGGGAGEYVEFYITNPVSQYSYSIGAGGAGGTGTPGGNGASGQIIIEATYNGDFADALTPSTSGTIDYSVTTNYIIKVTPDTPMSTETVVTELGGMTGVISCGTGLTCADQTISVNSFGEATTAIKIPVKAATTANIGLFGAQTIDGVSVVAGDRILVKDQSTASENGIYVVSNSNWARATDFNEDGEVVQGSLVYVTNGTINGNISYNVTTANPISVGSTSISFGFFGTGFQQNGTGSIVRTILSKNQDIINVKDFGAICNNSTDDTTAINNAILAGISLGGATIQFPASVCVISSTLNINSSYITLKGAAFGADNHDIGSNVTGTTLRWNGSVGGKIISFSTISGVNNQRINGVGMLGIALNGNGTAAKGLEIISARYCQFENIYISNVTEVAFDLNTVSSLGEGTSLQFCKFDNLQARLFDTNSEEAIGIRLDASNNNGNPSFNTFRNISVLHKNGVGVQLKSADNNTFINTYTYRVSGGTGIGIELSGNNLAPFSATSNQFIGVSSGDGGVTARGTEILTIATTNNVIQYYDAGNSAPAPILGTGATLYCSYNSNVVCGSTTIGPNSIQGNINIASDGLYNIGSSGNRLNTVYSANYSTNDNLSNWFWPGGTGTSDFCTLFNGATYFCVKNDGSGITVGGSSSGSTKIRPAASASGVWDLPAVTDQFVGRSTADTLANKSIDGNSNTLTNIGNAALSNSAMTLCGASVSLGGSKTASSCLDSISSTRGAILERGASGWAAITPGTSGLPFVSNGSGADPAYGQIAFSAISNYTGFTPFTPTWSPTGGSSTMTVSEARYTRYNNHVCAYYLLNFSADTGTGVGTLTLPTTASKSSVGAGYESTAGRMSSIKVTGASANAIVSRYDSSYPLPGGAVFWQGGICYESQ